VIETFSMLPGFTAIDISKIDRGFAMLAHLSTLFWWPGISATISRRIIKFTKDKIDTSDDESYSWWFFDEMLHKTMFENFDLSHIDIVSYKILTEKMLRIGVLFETIVSALFLGFFFIKRGDFENARAMTALLGRIGVEYEHSQARLFQLLVEVRIFKELGKLKETIDSAHRGILLAERLGFKEMHLEFITLKTQAQVLDGNLEGSEICLDHQEEIRSNAYLIPYYLSDYISVRSLYFVSRLEEAVESGDESRIRQFDRESRKWGSRSIKASRKFKRDRVEVLRLMGTRSWLMGKRKKALKWWADSVETGERLKFRPDLSRTYFEIGRRLSEPNSPYRELNGISSSDYLNKAKTMFEEMGLQWDLEQLERVMEHLD